MNTSRIFPHSLLVSTFPNELVYVVQKGHVSPAPNTRGSQHSRLCSALSWPCFSFPVKVVLTGPGTSCQVALAHTVGLPHCSRILRSCDGPWLWYGGIAAFSLRPQAVSLFSKSKASLSHIPCGSSVVNCFPFSILVRPQYPFFMEPPNQFLITSGISWTLHFLFAERQWALGFFSYWPISSPPSTYQGQEWLLLNHRSELLPCTLIPGDWVSAGLAFE